MNDMVLKEELLNKLKVAIEGMLGDGEKCITHQVMKNNGVVVNGISITKSGGTVTPTVYVEGYMERYTNGETVESIAGEIYMLLDHAMLPMFDTDSFMDWDKVKMRICMRMVNRERNAKLLRKVPHLSFLDLEIVFYYLLPDTPVGEQQVNGSILIYNSHMERWGITDKELYQNYSGKRWFNQCFLSQLTKNSIQILDIDDVS